MLKNRILTTLFGIFAVILLLTFSIGLPIYVRGFYYMQIDSLGIPEYTGFTKEEIKDAYDEVLDFLTLPGKEFGTGVFKYSESGKSHFEDCKGLFNLNAILFIISLTGVIVLCVLSKKGVFALSRPFGFNVLFTCGASTLTAFALIGALACINFDKAFTIFHALFFPGKDNWLFDSRKDQIILAMPQDFFMNCAILIASSIILISIGFIVFGILEKRKQNKK